MNNPKAALRLEERLNGPKKTNAPDWEEFLIE